MIFSIKHDDDWRQEDNVDVVYCHDADRPGRFLHDEHGSAVTDFWFRTKEAASDEVMVLTLLREIRNSSDYYLVLFCVFFC